MIQQFRLIKLPNGPEVKNALTLGIVTTDNPTVLVAKCIPEFIDDLAEWFHARAEYDVGSLSESIPE